MLTKDDFQKLNQKFATKEDLINFKDAILHEIIKLREDIAVIVGYREMIEDHETRITKIEKLVD